MKAIATILSLTALLVLVLTHAPAASARNGWGLEDPQLCVNGQLLVVASRVHADVYVTVPSEAEVDYNVADCGGDSEETVVSPDHVTFQGQDMLRVKALIPDRNKVTFVWGMQHRIDFAEDGFASANFRVD